MDWKSCQSHGHLRREGCLTCWNPSTRPNGGGFGRLDKALRQTTKGEFAASGSCSWCSAPVRPAGRVGRSLRQAPRTRPSRRLGLLPPRLCGVLADEGREVFPDPDPAAQVPQALRVLRGEERAEGEARPVDVGHLHLAGLAVPEGVGLADAVTLLADGVDGDRRVDRLGDRELDPADDRAQRPLRGEADDQADDARRGEERDPGAADELELDDEGSDRRDGLKVVRSRKYASFRASSGPSTARASRGIGRRSR